MISREKRGAASLSSPALWQYISHRESISSSSPFSVGASNQPSSLREDHLSLLEKSKEAAILVRGFRAPCMLGRGMSIAINLSDEYEGVLRTHSYEQVYAQIHGHLRRCVTHSHDNDSIRTARTFTPSTSSPISPPSSPSFCYSSLPDHLLEPRNHEALLSSLSNTHLHALFLDYFNASVEACNICGSLLWSIEQLRREHASLQRLFAKAADSRDLASYIELQNPLYTLKTVHLRHILDLYQSLIPRITLSRDKILRKARVLRIIKKTSGFVLVVACGALATVVLVISAHAAVVVSVIGVPTLLFPVSSWMRSRRRPLRRRRLARLAVQLDLAARGAYIMNRDMETISRMVTRLHDEVEHEKVLLKLFLRSRESSVLEEAAEGGGGGIAEQLEELEEHVYWCLLTIKRTRELVAREVIAGGSR